MTSLKEWLLYDDDHLVAFNKPALIPTQPDLTGDKSLWEMAQDFLNMPLFVIHRLDRPTSGIVVFAKNKQAAAVLSQQFEQRKIHKIYAAIVEQKPQNTEGVLVDFLTHNTEKNKSFISKTPTSHAKRAELHYLLRGSSDRYHWLDITLLTGRHHQIRVQLAAIGCPIKGDVKYGARRSNLNRSIHLHARELSFWHLTTGINITLKAGFPIENDAVWQFFQGLT